MEFKNKKMRRREWVMVLIILCFIEYWWLQVSYTFKDENSVVSYISFAATIASLILAVVAIIYGFVQNESQKRSGDAVATQLESLRSVAANLSDTSINAATQVEKITSATDQLKALEKKLDGTFDRLKTIEVGINGLHGAQEIMAKELKSFRPVAGIDEKPETAGAKNVENIEQIANVLFREVSFQADIFAYGLYLYDKIAAEKRISLDGFQNAVIDALVAYYGVHEFKDPFRVSLGSVSQLSAICRAFGIIKMQDGDWDKSFIVNERISGIIGGVGKKVEGSTQPGIAEGLAILKNKIIGISSQ